MTAKEKTQKLYNKFFDWYPKQDAQFIAIQCVLIMANEFLEYHKDQESKEDVFYYKYWQDVKEELKKYE